MEVSIKTTKNTDFAILPEDSTPNNYQPELTTKLDALSGDFDQAILNEIVLWKVNRYVGLGESIFQLINELPTHFDEEKTIAVLKVLLEQPGIRLPMASTILRFKNPDIYQIIDQRVYRLLYGESLKNSTNIEKQINLYLDYLSELKAVCKAKSIPFAHSDRILYNVDKRINKAVKLKY